MLTSDNGVWRKTKECATCGEVYTLSAEYFFVNRKNPDGFGEQCKQCFLEMKMREQTSAKKPHTFKGIRKHGTMRKVSRRQKKALWTPDFQPVDWQRCLEYFDHRCAACGRSVGLWHFIAADHWIPDSKGGRRSRLNMIPLCHAAKHGEGCCNNSKSAKDPEQWLIEHFGAKRAAVILRRINDYFASLA